MALQKEKMQKLRGLFLLIGAILLVAQVGLVSAGSNDPSGPDRYTYIPQEYTSNTWWMRTWAEQELVCEIVVEHEGLPYYDEVYVACGEGLADAWLTQENCPTETFRNHPTQCPGYYFHLATSELKTRDVAIPLPAPQVWLDLDGCTVENETNRCEAPPTLILQGEEPINGEEIIAITGTFDGAEFYCQGNRCELPINETAEQGEMAEFWAISSYGDTSELFEAKIRVLPQESEQGEFFWYVDVISPQWRGEANPSCSLSWDAFPPEGGVPFWLSSPATVSELESDLSYSYLAGNLIERGVVDASQCLDFGIDVSGQATECGLEAAQETMREWQNRFDQLILEAAQEAEVPAVLLKRLFARESQFWPGVFNSGTDIGLGQLTFEGADFVFTWNAIFYEQFCPVVLDEEACDKGYLHLSEEDRDYLRDSLIFSVNATCDTCPMGINLEQADYSVNVFANTLRASCEQTAYVVYNNTDEIPGKIASYDDLWRFTLVNYNAGAGCLGLAVNATHQKGLELTWNNLAQNLTEVCSGTENYVNDIDDILVVP